VCSSDLSRQFFFDIPNDSRIVASGVRIDDVQSGALQAYIRCNDFAGDCPCYSHDSTCTATSSDIDTNFLGYFNNYYQNFFGGLVTNFVGHDCDLTLSHCDCSSGDRVYVSVRGLADSVQISYYNSNYGNFDNNVSGNGPIGFSMTANIFIQNIDEDDIEPIVVGSDSEPSLDTDILYFAQVDSLYDSAEYDFYELDFSSYFDSQGQSTLGPDDTLEIMLVYNGLLQEEEVGAFGGQDSGDDDDDYFQNYRTQHPVAKLYVAWDNLAGDTSTPLFCDNVAACTVRSGEYPVPSNNGYSYCSLVFEGCGFDSTPECFDTRDLRQFDDDTLTVSEYQYGVRYQMENDDDTGFVKDSTAVFNAETMSNRRWYVTVQNLGFGYNDYISNSFYEGIQYTLQTRVVSRAPVSLTDGIAFYGQITDNSYRHYSFSPSNTNNDVVNWLWAELWDNADQLNSLAFYMNYWEDSSNPVKAGSTDDCFYHIFPCDVCTTKASSHYCRYEIEPCDYNTLTGTYYFSVKSVDHLFFNEPAQYNIRVSVNEVVDISDGIPRSGTLFEDQTYYYSFNMNNVPASTNQNALERYFAIEIDEVIQGDVFVNIQHTSPNDECFCRDNSVVIQGLFETQDDDDDDNDSLNFVRFDCNGIDGTYYINVGANHYSETLDTPNDYYINANPVSFIIHSQVWDVLGTTLPITTNSSSIVNQSFDSNTDTVNGGFQVRRNEIHVYSFNINNPSLLSGLNIEVSLNTTFSPVYPLDIYVTQGTDYYTPSGMNDDDNHDFGEEVDISNCVSPVSCTISNGSPDCSYFFDSCELSDSTQFHITVIGETIPLHSISNEFDIVIGVVESNPTVISVPVDSNDLSIASTTNINLDSNDIEDNFGSTVYFSTSGTTGLAAGEHFEFSASGFGNILFEVTNNINGNNNNGFCSSVCSDSGSNPSCKVYSCNSLSASTWFFKISGFSSTSNGQISIQRFANPCPTCTTTSTALTNNALNGPFTNLASDEWAYFTTNIPAADNSEFELLITGGSLNINELIFVESATILPGISGGAYGFNPLKDTVLGGSSSDSCAIETTRASYEAECCYDTFQDTFAVIGDSVNADYNFEIDITPLTQSGISIDISSGSQNSGSVTINNQEVQMITVTYNADQNLFVEFTATSNSSEIYMSHGSLAGSTNSNDKGKCYPNDGVFHTSSPCSGGISATGNDICEAFIPACGCFVNSAGDTTHTVTFAIIPNQDFYTGDYFFSTTPVTTPISQNSNTFSFPESSISDRSTRNGNSDYSAISQFTFPGISSFTQFFDDSGIEFVPFVLTNAPAIDRPSVRFRMTNIANQTTSSSGQPFNIERSFDSRASTNNQCGSGNEANCVENGGNGIFNSDFTEWNCTINICNLACDQPINFGLTRNSVDNNRWTFDFSYEFVNFDVEIADPLDSVQDLDGDGFVINQQFPFTDTQNRRVIYRINTHSFADVNDNLDYLNEWMTFSFSNLETTSNSAVDVSFFSSYIPDGSTCYDFNDDQGSCSFDVDDDCFFEIDPCLNHELWRNPSTEIYIVIDHPSTPNPLNYTMSLTFETVNDVGGSPTTITDFSQSYSATKEIFNGDWHFYEFNLPNPDGYHGMTISINDVVCENNGNSDNFSDDEGVYLFTLFDDDDKNFIAPALWPTFNCATDAVSVHEDGSTSVSAKPCYYTGGRYRVGVFANYQSQQFINVPVIYTIDLTFQSIFDDDSLSAIQMAPEQEYQQVSLDNQYFEFRYDYGYNRGTEVEFYININSDFDDLTLGDDDISLAGNLLELYISKNKSPYGDDDCTWDTGRVTDDDDHDGTNPFTSTVGDYVCIIEDSDDDYNCVISIPPCEFENTIYYGFINGGTFVDGLGIITIGSRVDQKYIPVYDMVSSTSGVQITDGVISDQLYQYYRVNVDSSSPDYLLSITLYSRACEADAFAVNYLLEYYGYYDDINIGKVPACSFDMFVSTGIFGFSAGSRYNTVDDDTFYSNFDDDGQYGPQCTDDDSSNCPCFQKHCQFDDVDGQCTIHQSSCSTERDTMYIGITTYGRTEDDDFSSDDDAYSTLDDDVSDFVKSNQCSYELEITSSVSVETVAFDNKYCDTISCMNYYTPDTTNIDTTNAIYEIFVNNYGDADLTFYISENQIPFADTQFDDDCFEYSFACAADSQCSFKLSCVSEPPIVLATRDDGCFDDCFVSDFSIEFVRGNPFDEVNTFQTITANNPITITSPRQTLQYVHTGSSAFIQVNTDAAYAYTVDYLFDINNNDDDFDFSTDDNNSSCIVRLCDEGILFDSQNSHTYYFYVISSVGLSFEVQTLSNFPSLPSTMQFTPRSSESQFSVFSIEPPLGVETVTISFSDVTFAEQTSDVSNLGITYSVDAGYPAVSDCNCATLTPLTSGTCQNSFADIVINVNDKCSDTLYLTIGTCGGFTCQVNFDINVQFSSTANVQTITPTNHQSAFTEFFSVKECGVSNPSFAFTLTEDAILNVQTRNLIGETGFDYTITKVCNQGSDDDTDYYSSDYIYSYESALDYFYHFDNDQQTSLSTKVGNNRFYCASAGDYYIDFSFNQDPTNLYDSRSFEYKVINQYVPLSNNVADTISGHETHFYSFPNTGSFKLGLNINDGTSLKMIVHDGCSHGSWAFSEYTICSHGTCFIDMPTKAKASNSDTYYVIIESGSINDIDSNSRNTNDRGAYPTSYSLDLFTGAALCTSLSSSSGFCSDVFGEFSINSARVMGSQFDLKHTEAEWRYNKFIDRCPTPTNICKDWLKRLSCLESFPSCDTNSYQNPTCVDACNEVEFYCGAFVAEESLNGNLLFTPNKPSDYARDDVPRYEFTCKSDRYASTNGPDSSCISIPQSASITPSASVTPSISPSASPTPAVTSDDDDDDNTKKIEIYVVNGNDNGAREENQEGEVREVNEAEQELENLLVSSTSSDSSASTLTFSLFALLLSLLFFSFF
jgi:hypothetical protein